jgi:hypothetical protein
MEKKNNSLRRRAFSSSVLLGFLAILLCVPNVRADLIVPDGATMEIISDVDGELNIYGTATLKQNAFAADQIYAYPGAEENSPGGIVNIEGCAPGNILNVLGPGTLYNRFGLLPAVVTIYGSRFQIGTGTSFSPTNDPADDHAINDMLYVLDESEEVLFSLTIWSDFNIRLRAPGSEEKERLEAELSVSPTKIYRHRRRPVVFATLRLPEGVTKDDVDSDCPFMLSAGKNEIAIKASYKRMYQSCRQKNKSSRVKIFAFFNMTELLEGTADNCEEMQLQACGKLKSGQEFYGSDTIRIINPRKKHWRSRVSMRNKYRHR